MPADARHSRSRRGPDVTEAWYRLEVAKRRLVYTLLNLRLPIVNRTDDPQDGLAFEFLADPDDPSRRER